MTGSREPDMMPRSSEGKKKSKLLKKVYILIGMSYFSPKQHSFEKNEKKNLPTFFRAEYQILVLYFHTVGQVLTLCTHSKRMCVRHCTWKLSSHSRKDKHAHLLLTVVFTLVAFRQLNYFILMHIATFAFLFL